MLNAASPPAKWSCKPHEGAFWPPAKTQAMLGRLENTPAPRSKKRKTGNLPEIEVSQPKSTDPLKPRRNRPRVFCGHIFQALRRQTLHEGGAQLAAFFAASVANIFVFENGLFPWAVGVWVLSAALATTWCRLIKVGEIDSPSIYLNGIPKDVQEKNIWMDDVRRVSANQVLGFRGSS